MKSIFSHMTSFLIWVVMLASVSVIVICGMKIENAGRFHALVIDRVESSYYNKEVIDEAYQKAKEYGYHLEIEDQTVYDDRKDVKVSLTYQIRLPIFNVITQETLVGYAR